MQTFLPYADFAASAAVLDDRRLGKQRVETMQVLRALVFPSYKGWKNHPATKMWRGFTPALVGYGLAVCAEWERRGHADAVAASLLTFTGGARPDPARLAAHGQLPPWLGLEPLHVSHRSALVRKLPEHYRRFFPHVPDDLPYLWPPAAFPRWPVRRGGRPLTFDDALAELGWVEPLPGQREVVAALLAGRDQEVAWPAGAGATSTGLLAALCLPGHTVWVSPHAGSTDLGAPPLAELQPPPLPGVESRLTPSIARVPTDGDLAALRAEREEPAEFAFLRPEQAADPAVRRRLRDVSLLVLDGVPRHVRVPRWRGAATLSISVGRAGSSRPASGSPAG